MWWMLKTNIHHQHPPRSSQEKQGDDEELVDVVDVIWASQFLIADIPEFSRYEG